MAASRGKSWFPLSPGGEKGEDKHERAAKATSLMHISIEKFREAEKLREEAEKLSGAERARREQEALELAREAQRLAKSAKGLVRPTQKR